MVMMMRSPIRHGAPALSACLCLLLPIGNVHANNKVDGRIWLQRMEQALETRNYDGRYIHSTESQSETLRIIHRNLSGRITERLVSLDGSGREYLRTNQDVTTYMPDKREVVVEVRTDADPLLNIIPEYKPELDEYYDIATGPATQVLERPAQVVLVQPRDEYRYGYRLWLDSASAMPLKSQLLDRNGRIIEQMVFAELNMPDSIPDADLRPKINTSGYTSLMYETRRIANKPGYLQWDVQNLPPGFTLKVNRVRPMMGSAQPARHMVYSDGLSSVSIFIEQDVADADPVMGAQKVGSSHAFQREVQGYRVTAVGQVPAITVRNMVLSLMPQSQAQSQVQSKASR